MVSITDPGGEEWGRQRYQREVHAATCAPQPPPGQYSRGRQPQRRRPRTGHRPPALRCRSLGEFLRDTAYWPQRWVAWRMAQRCTCRQDALAVAMAAYCAGYASTPTYARWLRALEAWPACGRGTQ